MVAARRSAAPAQLAATFAAETFGAFPMVKTPKQPALTVVGPATAGARPSRELGRHGAALWASVTAEYEVTDAGGVEMLTQACLAADRVEALAEQISRDGEIVQTRSGPRSHPGLKDEVALRAFICRTIRALAQLPFF
jgi:hypothetical protein